MRLHRLEVEGFGPFRSRQVVDFDAFADDGIFLIAGRTGAGKSSILDAVCFGLYGGVPRYESGEKRLRSDHCEPDDVSEVVVEFSTPAGRFRVTRSPEYLRPAKRGGGMTKQAAAVALDEWTDAGWTGRAARAVDVGHELDEILQLSREQFLQVILLAQNRFSEFLLANSRERQLLLRRLFGTERFEEVQARFDERRRAAEQALGARSATLIARLEEAEKLVATADLGRDLDADSGDADRAEAPPAATAAERLEALRRAHARAEYRAERRAAERAEAEKRSADADAALAGAREDRRAQQERDRARAAIERLDAEEPRIAEARAELERARAAEALRSVIAAATKAETVLADAVTAEQDARQQWAASGVELEITVETLEEWAAGRIRESGAWERAAELESRASTLAAELSAAEDRVAAASDRLAEIEAARASLPERIAAAGKERDAARRLADRAPDLERARDAADARRRATAETARLQTEEAEAERALVQASTDHAAAQTALAQLRQRRLDGFSGELASTLVDGEPCPVCGSLAHPAPADHSDPVSADDIAAAEAGRDAAATIERAAADRVSGLRAALAAAMERADGRIAEEAEAEYVDAVAEYERSRAAVDRLPALESEVRALAGESDDLERRRAEAAAALAAAREEQAVLGQRSAESAALIAEGRGEFDTVAERLAATAELVSAASSLSSALAERERRAAALADAAAEQQAALAASAFDDVSAVQQALRSTADQTALDSRIADHAVQREKERAALFDLELRTLPEEPIDLAPVEQASTEGRALWAAAVDEAGRAAGTAERLGELIDSAAADHERMAEEAAAFELLRNLADTVAGRGANTRKMTLETFVLAAELEEIVEAANRRLDDMSAGRYRLRHSDALAARGAASGLGIVVFDAFTGQTRPAQSLSGGETFLSSLALALGLAEVVTARAGGIRLDTLFIDEGFGSLDGETLDTAMRTLDELREGGRTVGVISHVGAMQEQIPAQLTVRALPNGPSVIETR